MISYIVDFISIGYTIPDPCFSDPCHVNASCNREGLLSEEFTCTCDSDFTGDGYNCTEVEGRFQSQHNK